jgi:glutamate/aspartate transport system substrate-binding protein
MVPRNDSAFELVGKRALADIMRSGEILDIYSKWFDALDVPADDLLKASFTVSALPE